MWLTTPYVIPISVYSLASHLLSDVAFESDQMAGKLMMYSMDCIHGLMRNQMLEHQYCLCLPAPLNIWGEMSGSGNRRGLHQQTNPNG